LRSEIVLVRQVYKFKLIPVYFQAFGLSIMCYTSQTFSKSSLLPESKPHASVQQIENHVIKSLFRDKVCETEREVYESGQ